MDVEEGAAGPRDAAGGADVGAVGGQDGTDPVSTGGEAVVNAGSEYLAVDASSPRRHRRDCVSMTASARWRERLELLNVVDWGLSRLPPALRINGDVSRSRLAVTFRVRV